MPTQVTPSGERGGDGPSVLQALALHFAVALRQGSGDHPRMEPQPPALWSHMLFESPWLLAMGLVGVGVVLRLVGQQRGQRRVVTASWVALAAAVAVIGLAKVVTTDRERLLQRTRELVAATAPLDGGRVAGFLAADAVLVGPDGDTWVSVGELGGEIDAAGRNYPIASQAIRHLEAEARSDAQGLVLVDLRTTLSEGFGAQAPIPTKWLLTWRKTPEGWRVYRVQWLELMNQSPPRGAWR